MDDNYFNNSSNEIEDITFPQGTKYEKELNLNFKYFNVFWYDPNKTNEYEYFKKCFENVLFYKANDLESTLKFFEKESSSEWIVITPDSKGEELINNLEQNQSIKSFFIYCLNTDLPEKWAKNKKKIGCITSNRITLCKKFIELNKQYIIPNFYYSNELKKNNFVFKLKELKSENKFALNSAKREIKQLIETTNKTKNKYNIFCINSIRYLNGENCINDFKEPVENEDLPWYIFLKQFKTEDINFIKKTIKYITNFTLLSLYFSNYQYLFNLLTYDEVKKLAKEGATDNYFGSRHEKAIAIAEKLCNKIRKNESILNEKNDLKELQIYFIYYSIFIYTRIPKIKDLIGFYQILNFFRDFDFSLKIYIYYNYTILNNKNHCFSNDITSSLILSDIRFFYFSSFLEILNKPDNEFNEREQKKINDSLTIKDFLIIGNKAFQQKIKIIESDLNSKSIKYLEIDTFSKYIKEKKAQNLRVYFYYLIINLEDFQENLEKIILLSAESGITFIILLYIENESNNIIFHKNAINFMISIILVYSPEDILRYISKNVDFKIPTGDPDYMNDILKIKIPKISYEVNNEEDCQDGCFELAETFDINLIKNKIVLRIFDNIDSNIPDISYNIYNIYKDHNSLDLFHKQNGIYFGFYLNIETQLMDICFIKRILYMYCREEKESQKSFYRIINDDLRTRNPTKIFRYIDLLSLIYKLIENEELASYKGKVYRATKLDEKLILKLKPNTIMVNTTFWSTSKDFKIAEKFMKRQKWRNSYIICDTVKNNIDIDFEKLNPYAEKEVLFLPFTEFKVKKISIENKFQKKIFVIELSELGNKNFVNYDNMNIENANSFDLMAGVEKELSKMNYKK